MIITLSQINFQARNLESLSSSNLFLYQSFTKLQETNQLQIIYVVDLLIKHSLTFYNLYSLDKSKSNVLYPESYEIVEIYLFVYKAIMHLKTKLNM